jgi:hypothetical protein
MNKPKLKTTKLRRRLAAYPGDRPAQNPPVKKALQQLRKSLKGKAGFALAQR